MMEEEEEALWVSVLVDLTLLPHHLMKADFLFKKDFRFDLKIGDFQYVAIVEECEPPLTVGQNGLVKIGFVISLDHMQFLHIGTYVKVLAGTRHFIGEGTVEKIVSTKGWNE